MGHKRPEHGKRHAHDAPAPDFWALLTAFVVSATAGFALYSVLHNLQLLTARMHAATAAPAAPTAAAVHAQQSKDGRLLGLQLLLETRVCGSPAVDGYAHVNASCILASPTAQWYTQHAAAARAGRRRRSSSSDLVVHLEPRADYDGLALVWGVRHTKATALECARACWQHRPGSVPGPLQALPCNAFSFCDAESCFQPDAHQHSRGDCWLKFTEAPASPEVNMRGDMSQLRMRHPGAPAQVQWVVGVLLPPGVQLTNGTWSPRADW